MLGHSSITAFQYGQYVCFYYVSQDKSGITFGLSMLRVADDIAKFRALNALS